MQHYTLMHFEQQIIFLIFFTMYYNEINKIK